jgi:hypothetical protein
MHPVNLPAGKVKPRKVLDQLSAVGERGGGVHVHVEQLVCREDDQCQGDIHIPRFPGGCRMGPVRFGSGENLAQLGRPLGATPYAAPHSARPIVVPIPYPNHLQGGASISTPKKSVS